MRSAQYVGRVGALAVALGIGAVIAGVPGVAWAAPEGESDPSDAPGVSAPENPDGSTGDVSDTDVGGGDLGDPGDTGGVGDAGDIDGADDPAGEMKVGNSGGAITSKNPGSAGAKSEEKDRDADPPKKRAAAKQKAFSVAPSLTKTTTHSTEITVAEPGPKVRAQAPALGIASPKDPGPQIKPPTSPPLDVAPLTLAAPGLQKQVPARMTAVTKPLAQSPVLGLLRFVTLAPTADGKQPGTTESPLLLGFLAAGRQVDKKASVEDESTARMADSPGNSLMLMAAAVNSAPTGTASTSTPNQATGAVAGTVTGVDVDGNTLTYSVPASGAGAPTKGTVSINKDTGVFTYQPSTGARLAAQSTSAPDFDTFTVSVNDGQASTPVTVSVAVLPAVTTLAVTDTIALGSGANPSAVATYGDRTYVANATARTVKVINTDTNQVIATVAVQTSPSAIAVSPDGKSVWVANSGSPTVQRIDTQSNTVVATVTVGTTPTALAVNGDSVWVANAGSNSVSRISMATNTVVATTTVGSAPSALAVSGDKVYVANKSGNSISVISTATNQVVQTKSSVTGPTGLAVSGGKLYVTQQGVNLNRVLVLNSSTLAQIATINMAAAPTSVAVTPDGAQAYVTMTNHRVSVINTATNAVVSTTVVNSASGTGGHAVAVDATATNGKVYITDAVNNSVRVLSLARGNTAPVATANPSIDSTDLGLGTVTGSLNVKDWDGDTVTYTVTSQPVSSTITGTKIGDVTITGNGSYTFTPTPAARDQAAQSSAADTASFSVLATDGRGGAITVPVSNVPIQPLAVNHAPTAPEFQYFYALDAVTGEVRGKVIASDVDGDPLTYQLMWGPYGAQSFTFNNSTGEFSYIPSREMRESATIYPEYGYDTFRVTISDGTASVSPWVNLEVLTINVAPTAYNAPEVNPADPVNGRISGSLNVYDPNGDAVTYAISGSPTRGTATVNSTTGVYTYTPFASERSAGGLDSFTVSATDGHDTSTFTVTVPVRVPELTSVQTQIPLPGSGPTIAVSGSRAYVFNKYQWTVTAIDTTTNTVIRTSQPLASGSTLNYPGNVAVSPNGSRVFVANWVEGKIIELDPNTLTPVGQPIAVAGGGDDMVFSPDGTRLYVAHDGANAALSIIDTGSRTVIGTLSTTSDTTGMAISSDGSTLYVADGYYNRIQVIDTSTKAVAAYIPLGPQSYNSNPADIALSPDGNWAYISDPDNATVSVIDLTQRAVVGDPIVIGVPRWMASTTWPTSIAVSPDGNQIYVANGQDIVVIDAATRAVVGAVRFPGYMSDTSARASQAIAVDSDGDVLAFGGSGLVSVAIVPAAAQAVQSGSMMMLMAAAVNSAPTGTASTSTPNQATGAVAGTVTGVDVDGNTLTYSVPASGAGAPTKGTVSINKDTGVFTYQPSTGARLAAQSTSAPDFDTFTVSVNDGQASTPVTVSVAVLPAVTTLAVTDTIALGSGANPSAVATYGDRTYVANATARTVKVINTDTNQVIATVAVQTSPSAIAVSPDGKSVWVANSGSPTVQRIDTQSNTVVATVTVGTTPTALAVNGDSVWVANAGSNSVSRISMATNTVVATTTVGSAPSALAVSGDKVYVANKSGNSISVISTATNQVVQTKSSVTGPTGLAVSGGKLYVTQQGVNLNRVLVLNSSTLAQIATINMAAAPTSVAVTPDGAQAYVTMTNHRVSVINTATNAVVSTTVVNSASGTGGHAVAVDATATNGKVYITDAVNNSVRVLSLARGNTAPVATANPSIDSTDLGLGTVTGSLNVKDWDGDTVTYTVTSQPVSSTITGTKIGDVTITANGIYTFTPTPAARDQAAQTTGVDTATFTVRATDSLGPTKDVSVTVTVAPTPVVPQVPVTITAIPVNSYPTAVAFSGNNAFVYGGDVIWTIDTRTNEITDWVAFYNEPAEISDGTRRYEAGYMSVSVIDNQTNAVIDTIDIPNCDSCGYGYSAGLQELALSPDGTRLYARHTYWVEEWLPLASAVTVIDTSNNNEFIGTSGPIFAKDIEVGADGRVYAIDEDWYYPNVNVYDKDMRYLYSIPLTSWTGSAYSFPTTIAMSTDGKHAFLHVRDMEGGGMTVSIIDTDPESPTYNTETFLTERYTAVSPDGSRLYVPEPDGKTISVYDTATNAKVGSFVTDGQANTSPRGIYFAPNGTLYIADPGDNTLYAVTLGGTTVL